MSIVLNYIGLIVQCFCTLLQCLVYTDRSVHLEVLERYTVSTLCLCSTHTADNVALGVAFDPAFVIVVEADVDVDVCFVVTGSILQSFSVTVTIDQAASTATLGEDEV